VPQVASSLLLIQITCWITDLQIKIAFVFGVLIFRNQQLGAKAKPINDDIAGTTVTPDAVENPL
jgi:hypothetical protein